MRRQAGHQELAVRLVEIQYELTDRLTFYLCGRRPGEEKLLPGILFKGFVLLGFSRASVALSHIPALVADHRNGQHFIIPQMADRYNPNSSSHSHCCLNVPHLPECHVQRHVWLENVSQENVAV